MTKSQPASLMNANPAQSTDQAFTRKPGSFVPSGSYGYDSGPSSRKFLVVGAIISATFHAVVFFGINPPKKKPAPAQPDHTITLNLEFAEIKELEEEEPLPSDTPGELPEPGELVPMQADTLQIPQPTDFVQELDFASLIEQPQMNTSNLTAIPDHISRGGKIGEGIGKIFNLADLDRQPVPVLQPVPQVPVSLKQEGVTATVQVQFVVAADGRVLNPFVTESTDHRFDDAAVMGVSKWKFKPGIKSGRKVNTRMLVPIVFKVTGRDT
jgi:TonB family protein